MNVKEIIDLLKYDDLYNQSELIDIAKGKYKIPTTWKQVKNMFKRM